jgi:FkbM family methyltransferase
MSNTQSTVWELDRMKLDVRGIERDFFFRRNSSDSRVISQIFHENCYDLGRLRRFKQVIEFVARNKKAGKRPLIVDAGANIGASSVYFAVKFPDALVVAIEPDLRNFELLAENSKGLNVCPLHCALAATTGRHRVVDVGEGFWGYRTQSLGDGEKGGIRSITMNQVYEAHAAEYSPFIVKIDIEGGEKDLFSTDVEWVRRTPLLIIELHDWLLPSEGTSSSFLQCVSGLDRDFVYIGEDIYSIANDLEHCTPRTDEERAMSRAASTTPTKPIAALEEPLEEELASAMRDFQSEIRVVRHTDDELRVALNALNAQKAQLEKALATERATCAEAQQALASTKAEWARAQQEARDRVQELESTQQELSGRLIAAQQDLSDTQEGLAATQQELTNLRAREKSLVSELALAINGLQQLRDQVQERDQSLSVMQQTSGSMEKKLTTLRKQESAAVDAAQRLKAKLRARSEELVTLREQRLVRMAVKVGHWINKLTNGRRAHPLRS